MIDGPYIYDQHEEQFFSLTAEKEGEKMNVTQSYLKKNIPSSHRCFIDHPHGDYFDFELEDRAFITPFSTYKKKDRLFVLADIEGNFDAFQRLLRGNNIIDENYNWIFGTGHLVLVGDFVDRGQNVIPLLWLIYKLEFQAKAAGGQVHFILGNHEDFFVTGNIKYVNPKYIEIARAITGLEPSQMAFQMLNRKSLVLYKWMLSKNAIEKIGDILFVHAGISQQLLATKLKIDDINKLIRIGLPREPIMQQGLLRDIQLVFGPYGPLWYRGFVFDYKDYKKEPEENIQKVLDYFDAKHIVIGHNMVDEISADYNKKLYRIDVEQSNDKFSGNVQGLLIEDGKFYRVDDKGGSVLI